MALKSFKCLECEGAFTREHYTGRHPAICSALCRNRRAFRKAKVKMRPKCIVPDCERSADYKKLGVCNSCYYRLKRTGTIERRPPKTMTLGTNGYVKILDHAHPLAARGYVYEHRAVLFAAIGPGPHRCHWCGVEVDWIKGFCRAGALVPDHLDGNKQNNDRANLVPACNPCNAARGLFMRWVMRHADDPFLWAMYLQAKKLAVAS